MGENIPAWLLGRHPGHSSLDPGVGMPERSLCPLLALGSSCSLAWPLLMLQGELLPCYCKLVLAHRWCHAWGRSGALAHVSGAAIFWSTSLAGCLQMEAVAIPRSQVIPVSWRHGSSW